MEAFGVTPPSLILGVFLDEKEKQQYSSFCANAVRTL